MKDEVYKIEQRKRIVDKYIQGLLTSQEFEYKMNELKD